MPKQLRIYRQDFELTKTEVWRPNVQTISGKITSKLLPMEMSRVSPQCYVVLSKTDLDILEPWKVAVTRAPKPRNRNKKKKAEAEKNSREAEVGPSGSQI